jgi:hypothetical protein
MSTSLNKAMKRDNDELYTPKVLVDAIMPFVESYIDKLYSNWNPTKSVPRVWCPFDTKESEFVYALKEKFGTNIKLIHSHISEENGDFFERIKTIGDVDLVLSNPPFSKKLEIIKTLNEHNFVWSLCMNLESLNYQIMGNYFADNPISLVIPDKKVSFDGNTSSFNTSYFCDPRFICEEPTVKFVHCPHNNTGANFMPSRMYKKDNETHNNP